MGQVIMARTLRGTRQLRELVRKAPGANDDKASSYGGNRGAKMVCTSSTGPAAPSPAPSSPGHYPCIVPIHGFLQRFREPSSAKIGRPC